MQHAEGGSGSTGGPFKDYPELYPGASGQQIRASLASPALQARSLSSMVLDLGDDTRQLGLYSMGLEPMVEFPTAAQAETQNLAASGTFGVAVLLKFADTVDHFDTAVRGINTDYTAAYTTRIGQLRRQPAIRDGEKQIDHAAVASSVHDQFEHRYKVARGHLEAGIDQAELRLKNGPTDAAVRDLVRRGLIPLELAALYPTVKLSDADRRAALAAAPTKDGPNVILQYLSGEFGNFFGMNDSLPLVPLLLGVGKMTRMSRGIPPIFQTGIVGKNLLAFMQRGTGPASRLAVWLDSPAARGLTTKLGIAGGVFSTGLGLYDLYEQGNPVDAFKKDKAGYVSDVAKTTFSASTTAFLIAPNPITGGIAVTSGVVWAGAEVVDHWDDIKDFGGDVVDGVGDKAGDLWHAATPW